MSVAHATEASAALAGGADVIDAKDSQSGALGAVSIDVLREIHGIVSKARPLTAALGDVFSETAIERAAREFAEAGAVLVKVGFAGIVTPRRVEALIAAAVQGAEAGNAQARVVAVAYADADRVASIPRAHLVEAAERSGARACFSTPRTRTGPACPIS